MVKKLGNKIQLEPELGMNGSIYITDFCVTYHFGFHALIAQKYETPISSHYCFMPGASAEP